MPAWGSLWGLLGGQDEEISRLMQGGAESNLWRPDPTATAALPGPHAAHLLASQSNEIVYQVEQLLSGDQLSGEINADLHTLSAGAGRPHNASITIRHVDHGGMHSALLFCVGLVDKEYVQQAIVTPLLQVRLHAQPGLVQQLRQALVPANAVESRTSVARLTEGLFRGETVLLIDGQTEALAIETKKFPSRKVSHARNEPVVRGPQEAFVEDIETNIALIRRRLQDRHVYEERLRLGRRSRLDVSIIYVADLAAGDAVAEMRRRLRAGDQVDIITSGIVEQLIEDAPSNIMPQVLATERPDRVVGFLSEGHIAICIDGDPWVLILPASFWSMLHTSEDSYLRWPYSSFSRLMRVIAVMVTMCCRGSMSRPSPTTRRWCRPSCCWP